MQATDQVFKERHHSQETLRKVMIASAAWAAASVPTTNTFVCLVLITNPYCRSVAHVVTAAHTAASNVSLPVDKISSWRGKMPAVWAEFHATTKYHQHTA